MATKKQVKPKAKEPTWLCHLHYGTRALPLTVYDNHDGTFTMMDDRAVSANISAEIALRAFTRKMNMLVLSNQKLKG